MKRPVMYNPRPGVLAVQQSALGQVFEVDLERSVQTIGSIPVVDIRDILSSYPDPDFDDYEAIKCRVFEAMETSKTVILRIHSPGGDVFGVFEAVREIRAEAARRGTQLVAYIDGICASAAYALACSCSKIFIPPTGLAGSIGCINTLRSQYAADRARGIEYLVTGSGELKADGNPHVAITDATKADQLEQINMLANLFYEVVSEARGLSVGAIQGLKAGVKYGQDAVTAGLCDQVVTWNELLEMVSSLNGLAMAGPTTKVSKTMDFKELLSALTAMAEGDGDDADKAKEMLKAMSAGDDDADKPADDAAAEDDAPPAKDDDKPEPEADDDAPPPSDDDKKKQAKASFDLFKAVATLKAEVKQLASKDERRTLLASRPDLTKDKAMKAWLESAPIATVRNAVKFTPKPQGKTITTAAAAVQPNVRATRGDTQSNERAPQLPPAERAEMDALMGLTSQPQAITRVGNRQIFTVGNGKKSAN